MKPTCSIDECNERVTARGWCKTHYGRWHDHGDPNYVSLTVAGLSGPVWVPLSHVIPARRAVAWAGQQRFNALLRERGKK